MTFATFRRLAAWAAMALLLCGCTTVNDYYDKWFGSSGPRVKPAELVPIKDNTGAKVLWHASVGKADKYVFSPLIDNATVYATGAGGQIVQFDLATGKQLLRIETKTALSGGVGGNGRVLLAGTARGEVLAFDGKGGKPIWKAQLTSEVLSTPQIDEDIVVVRTGDSRIYGLDAASGSRKWLYQRALPPLTVRTHVGIASFKGAVFAGFPGGRLVAMAATNGNIGWEAAVALPKGSTELERVSDVAGLPVLDGKQICAAAFQGRVACFDMYTGSLLWAREISSVAGMAMDARSVYVSDDKSAVVAFDRSSGSSLWKQDKLAGRSISGPVVSGRYVAVGDLQGYVHFLSIDDGSFVARVPTDGSAIIAQPVATSAGVVVQTVNGGVYAIGGR